ncbi:MULTISPECIES: HEXXH motif domain-containing protein [Frankia]|uniref:HEXXH motif domain-containing protein n=1 Tax=Frankia TaxID=1854 RepID=UPI001F5BAD24|nr:MULTISPECIES: HEXXH motif domain-containing protein [Frankia]
MKLHRLAAADFDELAVGGGGAEVVHRLRATQLSKRLLTLRAVMDDAARLAPTAGGRLARSFEVLVAAQRAAPDMVDELLLSPGFGLWAMHCLRRMRGAVSSPIPLEDDLAGLGALAVAAALRAGLEAEVPVLIRDDELVLPTLGRYRGASSGWAQARTAGGTLTLRTAGSPQEHPVLIARAAGAAERNLIRDAGSDWEPIPTLDAQAAGERIELRLDFVDPARLLLDLPMTSEIVPEALDLWRQRLAEGWRILCRCDPRAARAIAAGLTTVFPLRPTSGATELSASVGEAFGAVAMTLPKDGLSCAAALVHEFQHNKLSALLDLVTLVEPVEGRLLYAPWRADPRPLPGLLQGAYAYLGLTGFWDFQRRVLPEPAYAHFEFARWREEVWRVLVAIRLSGALTPPGLRFLDGMRTVVWRHRQAAVPAEPRMLARRISADTWTAWRLRNAEPAADRVAALVRAWAAGRPAPTGMRVPTSIRAGNRGLVDSTRLSLAHLRLHEPKLFAAVREGVPGVLEENFSLADRAYACGDFPAAAAAYKQQIADDPDHLGAWAGLALCRRETGRHGSRVLIAHPELVRAVHRGVEELSGDRVDPDDLAAWLPEPAPDGTPGGTGL